MLLHCIELNYTKHKLLFTGADLGEGPRAAHPPPLILDKKGRNDRREKSQQGK